MRVRNTAILLVLLIGLGAYVYFVEYPEAQKEGEKQTVLTVEADAVTRVSLRYADRDIGLEKVGGTWRLTRPVEADADEPAVKSLITAIAGCEAKKTIAQDPADRAAFGLDPPLVTIGLSAGDRELPALTVGGTTPVGSSAYVERAGDKTVFLTAGFFRSSVDKQVKDLRDKTILHLGDEEVRKIGLQGGGKDILLVKADGAWRIERPAAYAADGAVVDSLLTALRSMRAVDFPDETAAPSTYGLDAPRLAVSLWTGADDSQRTVQFGSENDEKQVYVKTEARPVVYAVNEWTYTNLDKSLGDLRDKTLLAFDAETVSAIEVARAGGDGFTLARDADKTWRLEGSSEKPSETKISQFARDLRDLKGYEIAGDDVADLAPFGLASPALTIAVRGENGNPAGTLLVGERESGGKKEYAAVLAGSGTVMLVRDYLFTRIDKTAADLVDRPTPTVAPVPPGMGAGAGSDDADEEFGGAFDDEDLYDAE